MTIPADSQVRRLGDLTRGEVLALAPSTTLLLPVGAVEQHGPHLPLDTDSTIVSTLASRSVAELPPDVQVIIGPTVMFGSSHHHLFACAASLSATTLQAVLNDIADSLVLSGFSSLFLLNGHGGNTECVQLLTKQVVLRHQIAAGAGSYWDIGATAARAEVEARSLPFPSYFPGHAGEFETSLMLAIAPETVRRDLQPKSDPSPPAFHSSPLGPGLTQQRSGEWERIDGFSDRSDGSTSEVGQLLLDAIVTAVAAALTDFHRAVFAAR